MWQPTVTDEVSSKQINQSTNKMGKFIQYDESNDMNASYIKTIEDYTRHIFKIILDEKKTSSQIEVDWTNTINDHEVKPSWFSEAFKVYFTVYYTTDNSDSDSNSSSELLTTIVAKIFSDHILSKECSHDLFLYELKMRKEVLPKIETLLKSKIGPKVNHYSKHFKIIFLENVLNQGSPVTPFSRGLQFTNCLEAVHLMAKLHAASVALHEQDPYLVKSFIINKIVTIRRCDNLMRIFRRTMNHTIGLMRDTYPQIATKMETFLFNIHNMEQIIDLFSYEPEEFCVLNNGDFSTDNIIFTKDSSLPLLQNYQMATYSSPAIDLHYFLNTSPETAVIYDLDEQVLKRYLETLTDTMEELNCTTKPPTMEQLKAAMQKRKLYAVFAGMTFRLREMSDTEEDTQNCEYVQNPYKELAKKMCAIMFHKGYFDCINNFHDESESSSTSYDL